MVRVCIIVVVLTIQLFVLQFWCAQPWQQRPQQTTSPTVRDHRSHHQQQQHRRHRRHHYHHPYHHHHSSTWCTAPTTPIPAPTMTRSSRFGNKTSTTTNTTTVTVNEDKNAIGRTRRRAINDILCSSTVAVGGAAAPVAAASVGAAATTRTGPAKQDAAPTEDNLHTPPKTETTEFFDSVLKAVRYYQVETTTTNAAHRPVVKPLHWQRVLQELESKRAIFLGEHHPDPRDHIIQAAIIHNLYLRQQRRRRQRSNSRNISSRTMVVGLEAVQRRFQSVLDDYIAGHLSDGQLQQQTEWETRWYWSFEAYLPILQTCRTFAIPLLALDVDTEDRVLVETGGLIALKQQAASVPQPQLSAAHPEGNTNHKYSEYIPDETAFDEYGNTSAYREYISYTLKTPYDLQRKMFLTYQKQQDIPEDATRRKNKNRNRTSSNNKDDGDTISYTNFVERQMLRDESMASACIKWLSSSSSITTNKANTIHNSSYDGGDDDNDDDDDSDGDSKYNKDNDVLFIGCIGINHATFEYGVPGRVKRMLTQNKEILCGTKPGNHPQQHRTRMNEENIGDIVSSVLINPEPINTGIGLRRCNRKYGMPLLDDDDSNSTTLTNQVCIPNSIGLQNYALQKEVSDDVILPVSDYFIFSS